MWFPWHPEWCKVALSPKMGVLLGNISSHIFAYNQSRLSVGAYISTFIAPNDHIGSVLLCYFRNLAH